MGIIFHKEWRTRAIFAAIIVMLVSLFVSRALLSVSIALFLVITTFHKDIVSQFAAFVKSPLLLSVSFLFLIPFISGLWSNDTRLWMEISIIKLPFFLLPVAFAGNWQLEEKQWKIIGGCFLLLALAGCCWSLWQYLQDWDAINKSYLRAKTIPTPLGDDHVRFSWVVAIAVVWSSLLMYTAKTRKLKFFLGGLIIFFVAYLHILSARSGVLSVYFFFLCFVVYLALQRKKNLWLLIPLVVIAIVASWLLFPTLQNRVKYVVYDFSFVKNENVSPGTSDANRLISIKAGWYLLNHNPLGVGAGDIREETNKWYVANLPNIAEHDKLFPSSEWVVYGDMAGWPAVLTFTVIMTLPLFIKKIRHRFFWIMLIAISIGCCVVETTLEIQFGIFIYCSTILCWWKWLSLQNK